MDPQKLHIAVETTNAIIDTLSNNDFVNVLKIGATTDETIHCFKDILAQVSCVQYSKGVINSLFYCNPQANNDNRRWLKDSVRSLKTGSTANFTSAFIKAFEILQKVLLI